MNVLEKNLLILASAGSGKTFQLGNRVIGLVAGGVAPERIVALTFTKKAAGEFADSVLMKLAKAAADPAAAKALREDLALPKADFLETLERVVKALPRFTLGTMDSFFSRVVRGFQYELGLTGGKFDLLEGPRADAVRDELLTEILSAPLEEGTADEFLHVFRRATMGKEGANVLSDLRDFVQEWQGRYRKSVSREWGPAMLADAAVDDWEKNKLTLLAKIWRGLDSIEYTDKRQREAMEKMIATFEAHTIGSGSLKNGNSLLQNVLARVASGEEPLEVKSQKLFVIGGPAGEALRQVVSLAAHCEMAAAISRTDAVRKLVTHFDELCESRLRRRGLLGFDDVKILMGEWAQSEDARLRREAVDFRLDARYDHWLLDEFQDTSGADWSGLRPLIDEAASDDESTMFIVGDRKQAIYGWRGGEIGLFDEVMRRFSGGLEIEKMSESWRSCPEVLALVNRVCGDLETMRSLFGEAAERWVWEDHFPAAPLSAPGKRGESRVEVVGDWEERKLRTAEILTELGVGRRAMTCGVLVRSNSKVREVADELRAAGFDVIEEGQREPAKDNPVGIALSHLLKFLANPADNFAWQVIEMSPLAAVLQERFGEHELGIWEKLSGRVSEKGFAGMVEEIAEACWADWSAFGRRRAGDIIAALANFDASGGTTPGEAADWIERLQVSQSPGVAAVQVMTIHKSKGLGFDVVIVPEVPKDVVPLSQFFTVAEDTDWICQTPVSWARKILPEMCKAEARWAADQQYEAFCMLYVALTRAKRGLYVLLEPPAKSASEEKASLANWVATSVESDGQVGFESKVGSPDWVNELPLLAAKEETAVEISLGEAIPRRERTTPSGVKPAGISSGSATGLKFGNEMHAAFEKIGWIDEEAPPAPVNDAGKRVAELLKSDSVRGIFERGGRQVELFREQPVEAILDGKWFSGAIDRLHVHRDGSGIAVRVEVIDFKTDAVTSADELLERYSGQMAAYREVMERAYHGAMVECLLVSTALREVIVVA